MEEEKEIAAMAKKLFPELFVAIEKIEEANKLLKKLYNRLKDNK